MARRRSKPSRTSPARGFYDSRAELEVAVNHYFFDKGYLLKQVASKTGIGARTAQIILSKRGNYRGK